MKIESKIGNNTSLFSEVFNSQISTFENFHQKHSNKHVFISKIFEYRTDFKNIYQTSTKISQLGLSIGISLNNLPLIHANTQRRDQNNGWIQSKNVLGFE